MTLSVPLLSVPESELEMRARLPATVYDLAIRLGVCTERISASVILTQTGRMKNKIDSDAWTTFKASQTISTRRCAFDWRARFGPFGIMSVRDAVDGADAHLDVKLLKYIPVAHGTSAPVLVRGELMRYLGEIALAPDAILFNTALRWRVDGPDTLMVSAGSGTCNAEVILGLNADGRIGSIFAPDRPRSVAALFLPTPWRGRFWEYRQHNGRWLPFAAEVGWEIEGELKLYWQGNMETWAVAS